MEPRRDSRWYGIIVLLAATLSLLLLISIVTGTYEVSKEVTALQAVRVIAYHTPGLKSLVKPPDYFLDYIVWQARLPRAMAGACIGMLLAMAGVAFQSFLMNPLADPYMVGVSAGSALGSSVIILLGGVGWLSGFAQPLAALAAGLAAMVLVTWLARINGRISAQTFLLAGIVLGTFIYSLTKLAVAVANRGNETSNASKILTQLLGSLQNFEWRSLWLLLPFGVLGGALLLFSRRELNVMAMGEETAMHLGVDTERFKRRIIVAGSLATAATVAVAGIIGFVGMVVPHMARRLVGPDHRKLLPASMLLGGIVLVTADWVSRVFLGELEVGVVTSICGAPVFCYLLRKRLVSRW